MTTVDLPSRNAALARLADETFDVVVVGGGVTGAGVALDAATRGFRTAIVEARDWASGTSSKSSKLVHGGLRYLQQKEFGLVGDALKERTRLLQNAPHLVHKLPFLIPLFGTAGAATETLAKGYSAVLSMYDRLGKVAPDMRHRRLEIGEAARLVAALDAEQLVAAFVYHDAQTDDARLTLAIVGTAVRHGAVACNYARVVARAPGGVGLDDGTFVRGRCIVNATGVWAADVMALDDEPTIRLRPAKGVHVAFGRERLETSVAVVLPVRSDKRSIFIVPRGEWVYVGTTDTLYGGTRDRVRVEDLEIDYLLAALNDRIGSPLSRGDVIGAWAGLRPLLEGARSERTADLSRRHAVVRSPSGMVSILGGKLTTYRLMAEDTVDEVANVLEAKKTRCRTAELPIDELMAFSPRWSIEHEQAVNISDIVERRAGLALFDQAAGRAAAKGVADELAVALGWSAAERESHLKSFLADLTLGST